MFFCLKMLDLFRCPDGSLIVDGAVEGQESYLCNGITDFDEKGSRWVLNNVDNISTDMQKDYFCLGTEFWFENVRIIVME